LSFSTGSSPKPRATDARATLSVKLVARHGRRDTIPALAGIDGADDDKISLRHKQEKAMLFYSNETARRLYREHVEKLRRGVTPSAA